MGLNWLVYNHLTASVEKMECITPQPRLRFIVTLLKFNYKTSNNMPKNLFLTVTLIPLDKIKRKFNRPNTLSPQTVAFLAD